MKYPNKLRYYRVREGLKEIQVASYLGLTDEKIITQWENSEAMPQSTLQLTMLSILFNVDVKDLFPNQYVEAKEKMRLNNKKHVLEQSKIRAANGAIRKAKKT